MRSVWYIDIARPQIAQKYLKCYTTVHPLLDNFNIQPKLYNITLATIVMIGFLQQGGLFSVLYHKPLQPNLNDDEITMRWKRYTGR